MNELHLFAGAGGGILAGQLLGHRCVCAVEREPYAQAVLVARQNDGTFPPFPIWDDVRTFDGRPWRGIADVFAEDSRARTSALQGGVMGWMESAADCGQKWRASFARFDQSAFMWKTAQCSLLEGSGEFSETWPRWGSMRNGVSYLRQMPAHPICESASGLWPTPTVCGNYNRPGASATSGMGLATAVKMWPTPCASASKGSSPASLTRKTGKSRANDRIDHAVMASDGGQLNPEWVEWLMGWPIGHTGLKPLATGRYREWLRQHSPCCPNETEVAA